MTTEELTQLRQLIREEIKAETQPLHKRFDTMEKRLGGLEQSIHEEATTIAGFFHATWKKMEETKEVTDKRINDIEHHGGITHKN